MARTFQTVLVQHPSCRTIPILNWISNDPELSLAAVFVSAVDAVQHLSRNKTDILVQQTELPGSSGFDVVASARENAYSALVMFSESAKEAAKAFDIQATDFVTLPADEFRFKTALGRAKSKVSEVSDDALTSRIAKLLAQSTQPVKFPTRIPVKLADRLYFVQLADIEFMEAEGNYIALSVDGKKHLVRETMNNMLSKLDPERFVRIHRSLIVNMDFVKEIQPWYHGDYLIVMKSGKKLTMSRTFRKNMHFFLEQ